MNLSVLDLVPLSTGQTSADAIAASLTSAELADSLGYTRYWFAEHHNMTAFAATAPPIMVALAASRTGRIRVGAGGVMLPNHSPLIVAEQFAALEAAFPNRIDLGLGRAPGSDPGITALLRSTGPVSDPGSFPRHVAEIAALVGTEPVGFSTGNGEYRVRATPAPAGRVPVWMLGSSPSSATLAAQLGLPYAFAHHIVPAAAEQAISLYRESFVPSAELDRPRVLMTSHISVGETRSEAERRALPTLASFQRLQRGLPSTIFDTIQEVESTGVSAVARLAAEPIRQDWIIDSVDGASARLRELAERFEVDEVMLVPLPARFDSDPIDRMPVRDFVLESMAKELLG